MYKIYENGDVFNIKTGRKIKHGLKQGYPHIQLSKGTKRCIIAVHILLMKTFKEEKPSSLHCINHINGNILDFSLNNLEWVTQKENIYHSRNITRNGAVISKKKIEFLFNNNKHLSAKELTELYIKNCK